MPAARLTERQKAEVVGMYRRGHGAQHLSVVFGCSPNTVIRAVKAALEPGEYERLKEKRTRRAGPVLQPIAAVAAPAAPDSVSSKLPGPAAAADGPTLSLLSGVGPELELKPEAEREAEAEAELELELENRPEAETPLQAQTALDSERELVAEPAAEPVPEAELDQVPEAELGPAPLPEPELEPEAVGEEGPAVLAIDDADDFGEDDDDLLGDDDGEDASLFVAVPLLEIGEPHGELRPRPLEVADLPASAYMLVDKTVELQPRPLSEFPELGRLPAEELDRRALMVFINPRQAKRLCGRTQRVIKLPDTAVLSRTAPFLLAQGISRVVIEGTLFALPGS